MRHVETYQVYGLGATLTKTDIRVLKNSDVMLNSAESSEDTVV